MDAEVAGEQGGLEIFEGLLVDGAGEGGDAFDFGGERLAGARDGLLHAGEEALGAPVGASVDASGSGAGGSFLLPKNFIMGPDSSLEHRIRGARLGRLLGRLGDCPVPVCGPFGANRSGEVRGSDMLDSRPLSLWLDFSARRVRSGANLTGNQKHPLKKILENRIAIIDGAMGTTIRTYGMTEADIRGERFKDSKKDLLNNGDLFSLTQPKMIMRYSPAVSGGRGGHYRDEHVWRDEHYAERVFCRRSAGARGAEGSGVLPED